MRSEANKLSKTIRASSALILTAAMLWAAVGCSGGSAQTITPAQEKAWRTPPKTPPPEYHGAFQGLGGPPKPPTTPAPTN